MSDIERASSFLSAGRLVAFPTETVYGLGADATNADAVRRIFTAKGRPATNPLIAHVADVDVARRYAAVWPDAAQRLAEALWPGPLSIVVPKSAVIVAEVSAGRATVGLRVPNHPLAIELLRAFDGPIAAPSANRSNRISPTTAAHVRDELGESVDLILDGGPCAVGIESTVIDLSTDAPTILRPGGVSRETIERIIGPVALFSGAVAHDVAAVSPGQQSVHYAPTTPAYRFDTSQRGMINPADVGLMVAGHGEDTKRWGPIVAMSKHPELYAQDFYAVLRELDAMQLNAIFIELPPDVPAWHAVRDRITRATRTLGAWGALLAHL
ncbi:MAG TPA: L-threonylcarbamoyladenylate synthase [Tepidisphaeraceae bacterium]|jgi:L-threonylcarbamoyladenylate synthase|nr:L-threonylcarbamoyladenylate synthase [Tepidisphaeraceae bacterium]